MNLKTLLGALIVQSMILVGCGEHPPKPEAPSPGGTEVLTRLRFANLPYGDHTYSIIGSEKGFFRDAGLDVDLKTIKIEEIVPGLVNGTYDVVSVPPGILFSSFETAPEARTFVFGDLFQGYALMARPDAGLKPYADFRAGGMDHAAAVTATVGQLKGRTFAYPTETAVKPFIDLLLKTGGVDREDFHALVLDDPLTVNAMRQRQADFQVGGVPSRLTLQREGFVPLISSVDLARGAKPSADSEELAAILQNGWATTSHFYEEQHATILRLASVSFRIMQFMKDHRDEATRVHMAYLSKVTGEQFSPADAAIIYDSLDPFFTFDEQQPWFHDPESPLYYAYVNGAILKSFVSSGVYQRRPPAVEDVIFADDIYRELESLKSEAEKLFESANSMSNSAGPEKAALLAQAREHYSHFNYYDAVRLARQVVDGASAAPR